MLNFPQIRNYLIKSSPDWLTTPSEVISTSPVGISIMKGNLVSVMTTIGSPVGYSQYRISWSLTPNQPRNVSMGVYTPFPNNTPLTE